MTRSNFMLTTPPPPLTKQTPATEGGGWPTDGSVTTAPGLFLLPAPVYGVTRRIESHKVKANNDFRHRFVLLLPIRLVA